MAKEIRPLKRKNPSTGQEEIFYPATTTDAVVDPNSRQSVTQKLSELVVTPYKDNAKHTLEGGNFVITQDDEYFITQYIEIPAGVTSAVLTTGSATQYSNELMMVFNEQKQAVNYFNQTDNKRVNFSAGNKYMQLSIKKDQASKYALTSNGKVFWRVTDAANDIAYLIDKDNEQSVFNGTMSFINNLQYLKDHSTLTDGGVLYTNNGYPDSLIVYDFKSLDCMKGCTLHGLVSWTAAKAYPIAFYDESKNFISLYTPTTDTNKVAVDIKLDDALLSRYPSAKYIQLASDKSYGFFISNPNLEANAPKGADDDWMKQTYVSAIFCGDSVTEGFVVEGDGDATEGRIDADGIYKVIDNASYPSQFEKMARWNITNAGKSGSSAKGWYDSMYPQYNFCEYDIAIIELGYNGISGDSGYTLLKQYLTSIVTGIKTQNPRIKVVMVVPSYSTYSNIWKDKIIAVAEENSCELIDLTQYSELSEQKYHGKGGDSWDYVHFNRAGYNAKARIMYSNLKGLFV